MAIKYYSVWGKYQIQRCLLILVIIWLPTSFHLLNMVFYRAETDYWCKRYLWHLFIDTTDGKCFLRQQTKINKVCDLSIKGIGDARRKMSMSLFAENWRQQSDRASVFLDSDSLHFRGFSNNCLRQEDTELQKLTFMYSWSTKTRVSVSRT